MNNQASSLTEEQKQEMLKHNVYKQENIVEHYNDASQHYEQVYLTAGWHDPEKCAELAAEYLKDSLESAKVLDMGCGTGLVGLYLS